MSEPALRRQLIRLILVRAMIWLLPAAERVVRRGRLSVRLALVGLARRPGAPAAAIAFMCVAVGLGGFALVYRFTSSIDAAISAIDSLAAEI